MWRSLLLPWCNQRRSLQLQRLNDAWMDGWMNALHVTLSRSSKVFQSGFKHLFGSPVILDFWETTRTQRHLSRAGTASLPSFLIFCFSFCLQFLLSPFLFRSFRLRKEASSFPFLSSSLPFPSLLPLLSLPPVLFPWALTLLRYNLPMTNVGHRNSKCKSHFLQAWSWWIDR